MELIDKMPENARPMPTSKADALAQQLIAGKIAKLDKGEKLQGVYMSLKHKFYKAEKLTDGTSTFIKAVKMTPEERQKTEAWKAKIGKRVLKPKK
jgi:hypothetical protein